MQLTKIKETFESVFQDFWSSGLKTDTKQLLDWLRNHGSLAKYLACILGVLSLAYILAIPCLYRSVKIEFSHSGAEQEMDAKYIFNDNGQMSAALHKASLNDSNDDDFIQTMMFFLKDASMPHNILLQNFTEHNVITGHNIIVLVPSLIGTKKESIVLTVSENWHDRSKDDTLYPLAIEMIRYLNSVNWLYKDVIFVFSNKNLPFAAGVQSFLRSYLQMPHETVLGSLIAGNGDGNELKWKWNLDPSEMHRGAIYGVVCLDSNAPTMTRMLVDLESVDGLRPNHDIVASFAFCAKNLNLSLYTRSVWLAMHKMAVNDASSDLPTPFYLNAVPILYLRGTNSRNTTPVNMVQLGRSLEIYIRDLSQIPKPVPVSRELYFAVSPTNITEGGLLFIQAFVLPTVMLLWTFVDTHYDNFDEFIVGWLWILTLPLIGSLPTYWLATSGNGKAGHSTFSADCLPMVDTFSHVYVLKVTIWAVSWCFFNFFAIFVLKNLTKILLVQMRRLRKNEVALLKDIEKRSNNEFNDDAVNVKNRVESASTSTISGETSNMKFDSSEEKYNREGDDCRFVSLWQSFIAAYRWKLVMLICGLGVTNWSMSILTSFVFVFPALMLRPLYLSFRNRRSLHNNITSLIMIVWIVFILFMYCPLKFPFELRQLVSTKFRQSALIMAKVITKYLPKNSCNGLTTLLHYIARTSKLKEVGLKVKDDILWKKYHTYIDESNPIQFCLSLLDCCLLPYINPTTTIKDLGASLLVYLSTWLDKDMATWVYHLAQRSVCSNDTMFGMYSLVYLPDIVMIYYLTCFEWSNNCHDKKERLKMD